MLNLYELEHLYLLQNLEHCHVSQKNSISQHHLLHVPCNIWKKALVCRCFSAAKTGLS